MVITSLGGNKEIFFLSDLFLHDRKFNNVIVEVKEVPANILNDGAKNPLFDLKKALWQHENYDKNAIRG